MHDKYQFRKVTLAQYYNVSKTVVLKLSGFMGLFQRFSTPVAPCLEYCPKRLVRTKKKSSL